MFKEFSELIKYPYALQLCLFNTTCVCWTLLELFWLKSAQSKILRYIPGFQNLLQLSSTTVSCSIPIDSLTGQHQDWCLTFKCINTCTVLLCSELCLSDLVCSTLLLYILSCWVTRDTLDKTCLKAPAKSSDGSDFYEIPSTVLQQSNLFSCSAFLAGLNCSCSA